MRTWKIIGRALLAILGIIIISTSVLPAIPKKREETELYDSY